MDTPKETAEPKQYEVRQSRRGGFHVVTHGQDGANQFEVDAARVAQDIHEPLSVTLKKLFDRMRRKPPTAAK